MQSASAKIVRERAESMRRFLIQHSRAESTMSTYATAWHWWRLLFEDICGQDARSALLETDPAASCRNMSEFVFFLLGGCDDLVESTLALTSSQSLWRRRPRIRKASTLRNYVAGVSAWAHLQGWTPSAGHVRRIAMDGGLRAQFDALALRFPSGEGAEPLPPRIVVAAIDSALARPSVSLRDHVLACAIWLAWRGALRLSEITGSGDVSRRARDARDGRTLSWASLRFQLLVAPFAPGAPTGPGGLPQGSRQRARNALHVLPSLLHWKFHDTRRAQAKTPLLPPALNPGPGVRAGGVGWSLPIGPDRCSVNMPALLSRTRARLARDFGRDSLAEWPLAKYGPAPGDCIRGADVTRALRAAVSVDAEFRHLPNSQVTAHALRKSAATGAAIAGVPIHELMAIGRWKNASTALESYVRADARSLRRASEAAAAADFGPRGGRGAWISAQT